MEYDSRDPSVRRKIERIMSRMRSHEGDVILTQDEAILLSAEFENLHYDPITHLVTRRRFDELLGKAVDSTYNGRYAKDRGAVALLLMDLDRFKDLNDEYGHLTGDMVLAGAGEFFRKEKRPGSKLGRWGGDEMSLLEYDVKDYAGFASRMVQSLNTYGEFIVGYVREKGSRVIPPQSISVGLTLLEPDDDMDSAIQRADDMLYKAKEKKGSSSMRIHLPSDKLMSRYRHSF